MAEFAIAQVPVGTGILGICPLPGRGGAYADDLAVVLAWQPALVFTMVSAPELRLPLGEDLAAAGVAWRHLPITDFGAPGPDTAALWPEASAAAHRVLADGGRVLAHCKGGCGRSGMAVMRLMVEAGEAPGAALSRLRAARPCAVETDEQREWASIPTPSR